MICINCQTEVSGKFCPECGQRTNVKRINFKEGWFDFWSRVYGFDGMFPRTLKELTFRPGQVALEFINKNRVKYYGPVGYCFLMITLFLLVLSMFDLDFKEFMIGMRKAMSIKEQGSSFETKLAQLISDNLKLFVFLMIPFQALTARYFFFRKSGFNFLENMVLSFYVMGHLYWINIASAMAYTISGSLINPYLDVTLSVFYVAFGYTSFITYQSKIKSFFKGIGVYVAAQLLFMLAIILCIMIYVGLLAWLDPDALQMFKAPK